MTSSRENAPSGMEEKMEEKTRSSRLVQVRSRLISRAPTESEKLKVMLIVWDSSFIVWVCLCVCFRSTCVLGNEGKVDGMWVAVYKVTEARVRW